MKHVLALTVLLVLCGCTAKSKPPQESASGDLYRITLTLQKVTEGSTEIRYLPEVGIYIDYSQDFESWHYQGRNREPYEWERDIYAAELACELHPDVLALQDRVSRLRQKYRREIEETALADKVRFEALVQSLAAEKNSASAGKSRDE